MTKPNRDSNSFLRILLSSVFSILLLLVGGILCFKWMNASYQYTESTVIAEAERIKDPNVNRMDLSVDTHTTLEDIASSLYKAHIITDKRFFMMEAKLSHLSSGFVPGKYAISSNMSSTQILTMLTTSLNDEDNTIKFTIPEGYTIEQIGELLASKDLVSKQDFLKAVTTRNYAEDYAFLRNIPDSNGYKYKLEGYLFPDTYIVRKDASAEEIIVKMLDRFNEIYEKYQPFIENSQYSAHQIITIASIIEQEARLDEERPVIASVIYNRLNQGMRLQMCSTIQYLLNKRKTSLTYNDLKKDSPYNTYLYDGLPLGPICNPGEACIRAALQPDVTDYFYFVLKDTDTGEHAFSRTAEEHNAQKAKYQQKDDINFEK